MFYPLKNLDLITVYTKAKLEAESERTFLGYFWWILDPLVGVGIYYLLFKVFLNRGGDDYIPFLFLGLITWKWFDNGISRSSESILGAASIFKKVNIHKSLFPSVEVLYHSWKFLLVFTCTILVYFLIGYARGVNMMFLPLIILTQFILIYGLGMFVSSVSPYLPDLKFFISYSMKLLFYPSGILFDIHSIPEKYQIFIQVNFLSGLIQSYRDVIMYDQAPQWFYLIYCLAVGVFFLLIGNFIINKKDKIYPKIC
jgi:lipopolysaccharide transport system permease protein